jgi:hypothetical protein
LRTVPDHELDVKKIITEIFYGTLTQSTPTAILTNAGSVARLVATMERRPGRALTTTYVRPTTPGHFQARVRTAHTGKDVKVTSSTAEAAVEAARRKATHPW